MKRTILYLLISLLGISVYAQDKTFGAQPKTKMDTVRVKGNRFIFINDQACYVQTDTFLILPDTADFYVRKNNMEGTDEFYKQLSQRMHKSKLSSLMYEYMFANNGAKPHAEEYDEQRFIAYERESIASIQYKHLEVFGSSVSDTSLHSVNKWYTPANRYHIHTRDWIIKKNLTFNHGDQIDPNDLVDSERLLRKLRYVKDARVMLAPQGNKRADVVVVTQDVYPYSILLSPNNNNDALFGVSNINIAGIGHELEYNYIRNGGSDFFYRVTNIEGSFIDSEINYAHHFRRTGVGAFLKRGFVTQDTKYAGGAALSQYEFGEYDFEPLTDITTTYTYKQKYVNLWVGRAFQTNIKTRLLGIDAVTNAVASAGVEYKDYYDRPIVTADTNYRYHDRTNYLVSLGLSARNYYKDRFILQFGRTEDIPTGSAVGVVAGYQTSEFIERIYLGFNYARGGYVKGFGYLNGIVSLGSFVGQDGYQNGILKIGGDYFTPLINLNQLKIRQFVDLTFSQALRPDEEYILNSSDNIGIRGIRGYYLRATTKFNLRLETVMYTPINIIDFRVAFFAFMDYTITQNIRNDFFNTDHFLGLGGGIRLRNDNLAVSTFQIRLAYYPSVPIEAGVEPINLSTSSQINIRDFDFKAPKIIAF